MFIDNAIWRTIVLCLSFCVFALRPFGLRAQDEADGPPAGEKPDTLRFSFATVPVRAVAHSRYRYMELIDERPDSPFLGLIETNTYYDLRVQLARPMADQLHLLMARLVGSAGSAGSVGSTGSAGLVGSVGSTDSVGEDTLAMQLRSFYIYSTDKKLNVYLRFNLYVHSGLYQELSEVDTLISTKWSAFKHGYQQRLQDVVGTAMASVIGRELTVAPDPNGDLFSLGVLRNIDQIKKSKLPLYHAAHSDALPDGVYLHYASFSLLKPDYTQFLIDTTGTDMEHAEVAVTGGASAAASGSAVSAAASGSAVSAPVQLKPAQLYAYVKDGQAYISVGSHYALLHRMGSDFYITSKILVASQNADMAANLAGWAVFFASSTRLPLVRVWGLVERKKFWMQMDYRYGTFEPVRPVD